VVYNSNYCENDVKMIKDEMVLCFFFFQKKENHNIIDVKEENSLVQYVKQREQFPHPNSLAVLEIKGPFYPRHKL